MAEGAAGEGAVGTVVEVGVGREVVVAAAREARDPVAAVEVAAG